MNLYYRTNQTRRWPSTANKHIQVVFWGKPAGLPGTSNKAHTHTQKHQHTQVHVYMWDSCLLHLQVSQLNVTVVDLIWVCTDTGIQKNHKERKFKRRFNQVNDGMKLKHVSFAASFEYKELHYSLLKIACGLDFMKLYLLVSFSQVCIISIPL